MYKIVRSSSSNGEVTNYYLDVIGKMLDSCGEKRIEENISLKECKKNSILVVPSSVDFIKLYFIGFHKQIYWMQGIDAEESYMRNGSRIRRYLLNVITKFTLKKCLGVFFVSEEMKNYQEHKYRILTDDKCFIMPCFNVTQNDSLKLSSKKYNKNVFAYVGSLSKWQCFEETLEFFRTIEKIDNNAELKILTFETEKARSLVNKMNIERCSVDSVPPEKVKEALSNVKFGFVLRKDDPVNRVATPTKLSSYLSAGVIPVFSLYLNDFYSITKNCKYVVPVEGFEATQKLRDLMICDIDINELTEEYMSIFRTYYNPDYYLKKYQPKMERILE